MRLSTRTLVTTLLFVPLAAACAGCGEKPVAKETAAKEAVAKETAAAPKAVEPPAPKLAPPVPEVAPPAVPVAHPAPETQSPPTTEPKPAPPVVQEPTPPAPAPEPPKPEPETPKPQPPAPVPPVVNPPAEKPPVPEPPAPPVTPAMPKEPEAAPPAPVPPAPPASDAAYVGLAACMKCHFAEAKSWKKTTLAKSMDALRPTAKEDAVRFDAKTRAGLDPAKDYTADATCLACHTTGYGGTKGYPAASMDCVSCEACHGPGEKYVAHKLQAIAANKDAKFAQADLVALGLVVPDESVCARCHNARNPTNADDHFSYAAAREKVHSHPKK